VREIKLRRFIGQRAQTEEKLLRFMFTFLWVWII